VSKFHNWTEQMAKGPSHFSRLQKHVSKHSVWFDNLARRLAKESK